MPVESYFVHFLLLLNMLCFPPETKDLSRQGPTRYGYINETSYGTRCTAERPTRADSHNVGIYWPQGGSSDVKHETTAN